jgi:hypothetical protein
MKVVLEGSSIIIKKLNLDDLLLLCSFFLVAMMSLGHHMCFAQGNVIIRALLELCFTSFSHILHYDLLSSLSEPMYKTKDIYYLLSWEKTIVSNLNGLVFFKNLSLVLDVIVNIHM